MSIVERCLSFLNPPVPANTPPPPANNQTAPAPRRTESEPKSCFDLDLDPDEMGF